LKRITVVLVQAGQKKKKNKLAEKPQLPVSSQQ
jgi:hypothetical protein